MIMFGNDRRSRIMAVDELMQGLRKVPLYEFCTAKHIWQAVAQNESRSSQSADASNVADPDKRFTCVTYNVFSGALSKSVPHAAHRTKSAISVLSRSKAHVIALQEVSLAFERTLRKERWLRQDWLLTSVQDYFETADTTSAGHEVEKDGCLIAIKKSMADQSAYASMSPLSGQQGKVLIIVKAKGGVRVLPSTRAFLSLMLQITATLPYQSLRVPCSK